MRTVFKYLLRVGEVTIDMPIGARALHVAEQHGGLTLWAEVDDARPSEPRTFIVRATGAVFSGDEGRYVGTVVTSGG
ncbi:MAG: hypothetical protein RLZZ403_840, partial [Pseudomonadota bacterium]